MTPPIRVRFAPSPTGEFYLSVRAAVTGRLQGPEPERIFTLLGPASLLGRVEKALARLSRSAKNFAA